eukprot:648627-Amphidinium_carterae.1
MDVCVASGQLVKRPARSNPTTPQKAVNKSKMKSHRLLLRIHVFGNTALVVLCMEGCVGAHLQRCRCTRSPDAYLHAARWDMDSHV